MFRSGRRRAAFGRGLDRLCVVVRPSVEKKLALLLPLLRNALLLLPACLQGDLVLGLLKASGPRG